MDKTLVIEIVKQVIAELRAKSPAQRVLVLFSGASTGFVAGMDCIKMMTTRGHQVTVVFTPSAVNIITPEQAQRAGATNIILPNMWIDAPGTAKNSDLVLVPTLSMNTASRLAMGLMDTLISTLVMGALLAGKPVIAIRDGADPNGNGGRVFGAKPGVANALKEKLVQHLETLVSFGIELVDEPDFLATVEARLLGFYTQPNTSIIRSPQTVAAPLPAVSAVIPGAPGGTTFITHHDLLAFAPQTTIYVSPGARFTPLAQETVKQLKLNVVYR